MRAANAGSSHTPPHTHTHVQKYTGLRFFIDVQDVTPVYTDLRVVRRVFDFPLALLQEAHRFLWDLRLMPSAQMIYTI